MDEATVDYQLSVNWCVFKAEPAVLVLLNSNALHLEVDLKRTTLKCQSAIPRNKTFCRSKIFKFDESKGYTAFSLIDLERSQLTVLWDELFKLLRSYVGVKTTHINKVAIAFVDLLLSRLWLFNLLPRKSLFSLQQKLSKSQSWVRIGCSNLSRWPWVLPRWSLSEWIGRVLCLLQLLLKRLCSQWHKGLDLNRLNIRLFAICRLVNSGQWTQSNKPCEIAGSIQVRYPLDKSVTVWAIDIAWAEVVGQVLKALWALIVFFLLRCDCLVDIGEMACDVEWPLGCHQNVDTWPTTFFDQLIVLWNNFVDVTLDKVIAKVAFFGIAHSNLATKQVWVKTWDEGKPESSNYPDPRSTHEF